VIERILPSVVVAVEASGDDDDESGLLPAEAAVMRNAVPKRRREFAAVRRCARRALGTLGAVDCPPAPLLPGTRGAPGWPAGVVGSMTHCPGYRAAAVARATDLLAVGIDAEPHLPLPDGVLEAVTGPLERAGLAGLGARTPGVCWDRLLFSAKESVFKAWFPLTGRPLGFEDAVLTPQPDGTFAARLLVPGPIVAGRELTVFTGRWLTTGGLVLTATHIAVA
jgi:4'-phosphopantetheinyl transferase EntD